MKIVFWTGAAYEVWGPLSSLEGGIGGSETAAIRLAEQLAVLGHSVTIIGQVIPQTHLGVVYEDQAPYLTRDKFIDCDVFVSSRELAALRILQPRCGASVLWCHDLTVGEDWRDEMPAYGAIFCLSAWARKVMINTYPHVDRGKFLLTRNGIATDLFLRPGEDLEHIRPVEKTGQKLIYSSSPDRGLTKVLDLWPEIRRRHSEAELHVYYGFENWQKAAELHRDSSLLQRIEFLKRRLVLMEGQGVVHHGRVGQAELAKAFMESRLWTYPADFPETSCISAMEAQAAGAYPIVSSMGALPETVRMGVIIDSSRAAFDQEYLEAIDRSLEHPDVVKRETTWGREYALRNLSWREVAEAWISTFTTMMQPFPNLPTHRRSHP